MPSIVSNPLDFLRDLFQIKTVPNDIESNIRPTVDMQSAGWVGAEYTIKVSGAALPGAINNTVVTRAESEADRFTLFGAFIYSPTTAVAAPIVVFDLVDRVATLYRVLTIDAFNPGAAAVMEGSGGTIMRIPHIKGTVVPKGYQLNLLTGDPGGVGTFFCNTLWVKNSWGAPKPVLQ